MELTTANISKTSQLKSALTSANLTEINVKESRVITWLDDSKVCFLIKTKIQVNGEWLDVGNTEIQEFRNSEESLKLLKSNVPEPFLTAVLAIWETSKLPEKITEDEVIDDE